MEDPGSATGARGRADRLTTRFVLFFERASLGIKQPSVQQIEQQSNLYLSTLRRFVEAAGGTMELVVTLPDKGTLRLTGLGDLTVNESS